MYTLHLDKCSFKVQMRDSRLRKFKSVVLRLDLESSGSFIKKY